MEQLAIIDKTRYCWKCFKDNPKEHFPDAQRIWLCGGCSYELRTWTNFLKANGLGVQRILTAENQTREGVEVGERQGADPEGIEGVKGGGNPAAGAKGREKT